MSKIKKYFTFSNSRSAKLLAWKKGDKNEKWAIKAIDTLIKRIKLCRGSLDKLEYALNNPNSVSECVLIPKNADGRLQVMHRKELPQVIYCRIWRWPDLTSHHELKSTDSCENPFSLKSTEICVNPYHYRRLGYPNFSPILVPNQPENQITQLPMQLPQPTEPRLPYNVSYGTDGFLMKSNCNNHHENKNVMSNHYNNTSNMGVYNDRMMNYNAQTPGINSEFSNYTNEIENYIMEYKNNMGNNGAENMNYGNDFYNVNNINNGGYYNIENTNYNTGANFYNVEPQDYNFVNSGQLEKLDTIPQSESSLMDSHTSNSSPASSSQEYPLDNQYNYGNLMQTDPPSAPMNNCINNFQVTPVSYSEPEYWASIAYYELNTRVGEIFHCKPISIMVDGYTDPHRDSNRFCLGKLSNVKRNMSIENTRRHIGKGLGLHYLNGELIAECLSDASIFVQSRNCNHFNNFHSSTVCKIQSGCNLKIFSNDHFAQLLSESVHYGFDTVYELTKMCTIRISFVKGWGAEYQRQDVTATPCWIEIHLNGPLKWLDRVLNQMGPSVQRISSVS